MQTDDGAEIVLRSGSRDVDAIQERPTIRPYLKLASTKSTLRSKPAQSRSVFPPINLRVGVVDRVGSQLLLLPRYIPSLPTRPVGR
jgi:hypothetical protein